MIQPTFKIYTLGCKVNQCDSRSHVKLMRQNGFKLVKNSSDIVFINSCCVTKRAMYKCRRMLNKARKENPKAKIILMGCLPKVYKEEAKKFSADLIWGNEKLNKLAEILSLKYKKNLNCHSAEGRQIENFAKSRYFIKIQDGCQQFCSYCIIPYARGKLQSRTRKEIINEVRKAVKIGYREIVLCGIHLGLYGCKTRSKKQGRENNLEKLLKELIKIKNLGRIRLSSIEVTEVNDKLINLMAKSKKICQHLHIPLQSGSDKILKLMNRPYGIKDFKNKINKIRNLIPNIAITTDIIVGFPSETKKDFKETYNFIKEIRFSRLHVFPFSAHGKTPAAKLSDKVKKEEIDRRARKLRILSKKLEDNFRKKFIGQELDIVIENIAGDGVKGKTEYYFDVWFDKKKIIKIDNKNLIGKIVNIKLLK